ncbi:hypothetical protein EP7_005331 [Isosphaeraceae bacterium EP7]
MSSIRYALGVLIVAGSAWVLLLILGFSTLAAGGLEEGSPEWWPTYLGAVFGEPATYIYTATFVGGFGLCLYRPAELDRPRKRMTVGQLMILTGFLSVLLGLFLRAASKERLSITSTTTKPNGTKHVVKEYRNSFGPTRTVETDEP